MNELDTARLETTVELANDIIMLIKKSLLIHGDDPKLEIILACALSLVIRRFNEIDPGFTNFMIEMLEQENDRV